MMPESLPLRSIGSGASASQGVVSFLMGIVRRALGALNSGDPVATGSRQHGQLSQERGRALGMRYLVRPILALVPAALLFSR